MQMQMDLGELAKGRFDRGPAEFIAARLSNAPTGEDRLMEMICERENLLKALKRVESNKGKPGVDGMETTQLRGYLHRHWDKIKADLLEGTHKPFPVRRAEIARRRRGPSVGYPDGVGPPDPAGYGTGALGYLGSYVLRVQLWVPARTVTTDGDRKGPVLCGGRLHVCRGY